MFSFHWPLLAPHSYCTWGEGLAKGEEETENHTLCPSTSFFVPSSVSCFMLAAKINYWVRI